jgi:hypothetical protein
METIKFTIEIPGEQVGLFLEALSNKFGGYTAKIQTPGKSEVIDNPESINEFVRRKQIEEWQSLIRANELKKIQAAASKTVPKVEIR